MPTQPAFPKLFHEYYAIHETIHAILGETNGDRMEVNYVVRRVRQDHPELDMGPATLVAAIKQAMQNVVGAQQAIAQHSEP